MVTICRSAIHSCLATATLQQTRHLLSLLIPLLLLLFLIAPAMGSTNNNNNNAAPPLTARKIPRIELSDFDDTTREQIQRLNNTFYALFTLCSRDTVCNDRFYIDYSPRTLDEANAENTPGLLVNNDAERFVRFKHLMFVFSVQTQSPLGRDSDLSVADYTDSDARWWLRLLRTARFCTDNEVWEPLHGCVCPPEKVCHVPDATRQHLELSDVRKTITMALVIVLMVGLGVTVFVKQQNERLHAQMLELAKRLADSPSSIDSVLAAMRQFGELTNTTTVQLVFGGGVHSRHAIATEEDDDFDDVDEDEDAHVRRHHNAQHTVAHTPDAMLTHHGGE